MLFRSGASKYKSRPCAVVVAMLIYALNAAAAGIASRIFMRGRCSISALNAHARPREMIRSAKVSDNMAVNKLDIACWCHIITLFLCLLAASGHRCG